MRKPKITVKIVRDKYGVVIGRFYFVHDWMRAVLAQQDNGWWVWSLFDCDARGGSVTFPKAHKGCVRALEQYWGS